MDISIIIITYNYERYIYDCINSCLNQESSDIAYEVIVVDDGSTDNTSEILSQSFPDNLRSYRISNSGIEKASNYGFSKAKGKYIVRVDADDILFPNYLSSIYLYASDKYAFFYSDYMVIDDNGDIIREFKLPKFDAKEIKNRGDFLATGTLFRSDLIKHTGGYQTDLVNSGLENYEFILKILRTGAIGSHVPKILFGYRRHAKNLSELKREQIIQNGKNLFKKYNFGVFTTNRYHPYGLEVS